MSDEHPDIERLRSAGKGTFPCPNCGAKANDGDQAYPYCPRGCTVEQMVAAIQSEPEECPKVGSFGHDSFQCLTCARRRKWVREKIERPSAPHILPGVVSLADLLAESDEPTPYLIEPLWPVGGHVILSGAAKVGKTTMRNDLIRALADGVPFLGAFTVVEPVARIVVLDLELTRNSLRTWLRQQNIENTDRVDIVPMRGQAHTLDVFSPQWCSLWVDLLRGADVVILDCLEPVLHALNLDANTEARKFLEEWGALLSSAGVTSSIVLHHHGHSGERAKGDSGILAWPDALWNIVCEDPGNPRSSRYLTAYGRDVDVPEGALTLDGHDLVFQGGQSRAGGRAKGDMDTLAAALLEDHRQRSRSDPSNDPGLSVLWKGQGSVVSLGRQAGLSRDRARAALDQLIADDRIVQSTQGASHTHIYRLRVES